VPADLSSHGDVCEAFCGLAQGLTDATVALEKGERALADLQAQCLETHQALDARLRERQRLETLVAACCAEYDFVVLHERYVARLLFADALPPPMTSRDAVRNAPGRPRKLSTLRV